MNNKQDYKKPIVFRRDKLKDFMAVLLSLLFVLAGFYVLDKNNSWKAWSGIVFFGFVAILLIIQLITNVAYLKLDEEGFEQRSLFRKKIYKWLDVKKFWKTSFRGNRSICFYYTDQYNTINTGNKLYGKLFGKHGCITSSYDIKTEDLLKLMNKYKRRSKKYKFKMEDSIIENN